MKTFLKNSELQFYTALVIVIVIFTLFKIKDLSLPYFWDEAWSYFPVIDKMTETTPTLFPNQNITPDFYRGHPLLFYFLAGLWRKIFGSEIWITKVFPLLIAQIYLILIAVFTKKFFNTTSAFLIILLLPLQSVFFVQSTFLLPEILLALFTLAAIYFYFNNKNFLTVIFLTLALYTKETGIVIWSTIALFDFIRIVTQKPFKFNKIFRLSIWLIPILAVLIFFVIQYVKVGWFLFPEHVSFIEVSQFFKRLSIYLFYIFGHFGRLVITLSALISLVFISLKNKELLKNKNYYITFLSVFIIGYLIVSALNFYTSRYVLSVLPLVLVLFSYFISSALSYFNMPLKILFIFLLVELNLISMIFTRFSDDNSLGYRDSVKVHMQAVEFCESQNWYDKAIYTPFLMSYNLTNPKLGYLTKKIPFSNVSNHWQENKFDIAIITDIELDKTVHEYLKSNAKLLKRYQQNQCWLEIYELK